MSLLSKVGQAIRSAVRVGTKQPTDLAALLKIGSEAVKPETTAEVIEDLELLRTAVLIAQMVSPSDSRLARARKIIDDAMGALK